MSHIKIVCRRDIDNDITSHDKKHNKLGDELILEADQLFMDTQKFFESVKDSLEKYFNSIERK